MERHLNLKVESQAVAKEAPVGATYYAKFWLNNAIVSELSSTIGPESPSPYHQGRGFNVFVFDSQNLYSYEYNVFDTWADIDVEGVNFANFINSIPDERIVAISVCDSVTPNDAKILSNSVINACESLGSTKIKQIQNRNSWAMIAVKGQGVALSEKFSPDSFVTTEASFPVRPKKVIFDTDMGWDDTLSLLYLMKNPYIDIIGITVTGCGETNFESTIEKGGKTVTVGGLQIALALADLGKLNVPVCKGTKTPTDLDHKFPQDFRNDMDTLMGLFPSIYLPAPSSGLDPRSAWEFITETLNSAAEPITILSLGGFTNLAKMLEIMPEPKNIEGIYAMSGAVYVDGNVAALNNAKPEWNQGYIYSSNYHAEWNVFVDPGAAEKIFRSSMPVTIIPLDACDYVILESNYISSITAKDLIAELVKQIFSKKTGPHSEGIPVPIFDPLATLIMAGGIRSNETPEKVLAVKLTDTEVNNTCGQIYVVEGASGERPVKIVQGVSQHGFKKNFAQVINGDMVY